MSQTTGLRIQLGLLIVQAFALGYYTGQGRLIALVWIPLVALSVHHVLSAVKHVVEAAAWRTYRHTRG